MNALIIAVSYKANSSTNAVTYYFAHNWRGDITSIYDGNGNVVAKYEYDVWGNVLTVSNASNQEITDPNHIANLNPFRYRSYYYDSESGLYYLMSRYYDPVSSICGFTILLASRAFISDANKIPPSYS